MRWANAALVGSASAGHTYLKEAMRGERVVSGYGVYDKPSWEPIFNDQSKPVNGIRVGREKWHLTCSSGEDTCQNAIDGTNTTAWKSEGLSDSHNITVDLRDHYAIGAVVVLPPIDLKSECGLITEHEIYLSNDAEHWGQPVAYGMWPTTNRQRVAAFEPTSARYMRLVARSNEEHSSWVGISELNVYANLYTIAQDPKLGAWGPTLDLPVVPAAGAQEATGQVMLWSSWDEDEFHSTPGGKTAMSRWDFRTNTVSKRVVTDTHHDMFCPGIAIDGTGNMVVTGGNDAAQTSLFNATSDLWEPAEAMNTERGYQAQTTLSDGRVFVIGGSWAGGSNIEKNGEVYDPSSKRWTPLPGAKVGPMLTDDMEGPWRADNHGWLFGWKNNTVFQAGPSVSMNWYTVEGEGDVHSAGIRLEDEDSMSGNAVMFDAVEGKILTFGGSPDYDKSPAHANAHVITLGDALGKPDVQSAGKDGQMHVDRVFHTSVVLPDGKVFIHGGQTFGIAFNEENVQFTPELYDPETNTFQQLQKNNMIRVYHSVSILVPDGRVLTGGGGLCGNCSANHYDAQIYTPPYLLTETGEERKRPTFRSSIPRKASPGGTIRFMTTNRVETASLVRISSASHTVNTDQRRIPLEVEDKFFDAPYPIAEVTLPKDPGVLIPGHWMFFVMDEFGTPSIAKTILITPKKHLDASQDKTDQVLRVYEQEHNYPHQELLF